MIRALSQLGPDAVGPLIALLASVEGPSRPEVVAALGQFGPEARGAFPALLAILGDDDADEALRRAVGAALQQLGPAPLTDLFRALKATTPASGSRRSQALFLVQGEPEADAVAPVLLEQLRSPAVDRSVGSPPSSSPA